MSKLSVTNPDNLDNNSRTNNRNKQEIRGSLLNFVTTILKKLQEEIAKEIDEYLHSDKPKIDDIEFLKIVIEICPEFLATKMNE